MPEPVKTIENPLSGERIEFDVTGAETGGAHLSGRIVLAPFGAGPPEHVHPKMEERFRIVSGHLTARVGGSEGVFAAGEEIRVAPGTPHRWWNRTDEPVELEFHVTPGLPLDGFLENVFALAHMGLTDRHGMPNLLRMSRILPRYWDVLHLARPPLALQKAVMTLLSPVAWALRYPTAYDYPYAPDALEFEDAAGRA